MVRFFSGMLVAVIIMYVFIEFGPSPRMYKHVNSEEVSVGSNGVTRMQDPETGFYCYRYKRAISCVAQ